MGFLNALRNKAKGIDPFYEDVRTEQIDLYQHYFNKVIQSVDVDNETNWSISKPYDKDRFRQDETIQQKIFVEEASAEGLLPGILQVLYCQYLFADVYHREMDRDRWVKRVMHRKEPDYFPSGWKVRKLLEAVT